MTTVVQKPDFYSFLGNLKKVVLNTSKKIIVKLCRTNTNLLDLEYEPSPDGTITIDLKNAIASSLSFTLPGSQPYIETDIEYYTLKVNDDPLFSFYVIPGGIAGSGTAENFLPYNFLTWQPQSKKTAWNTPNWLRYVCIHDDCKIMLKAYFEDKTTETSDLQNVVKHKCYTFNLQFS